MINIAVPGLLDAVMHVLLAAIAMTLLFHKKMPLWLIITVSIIMELITDGAHIVNKNYTHNIIFFLELPLMLMLAGYMTNKNQITVIAMLMLVANITHLIMDAAMEGDALALYYPVYSGTYTWDFAILGSKLLGGLAVWGSVIATMKLLTTVMFRDSTPLRFPPPYHIER